MNPEGMPQEGHEIDPSNVENKGNDLVRWTDSDGLLRETTREEMLEHQEAKREH